MEKVQINAFALKHPLGVHPEIDLISTEQERSGWEGKQINVEVGSAAEEKGWRVPLEAWPRYVAAVHGLE